MKETAAGRTTLVGRRAFLGAVLVAALGGAATLPLAYAGSEVEDDAQSLREEVTRAVATQRLEATGTWFTEDGKTSGIWRVLPRIRQADANTWCATILWEEAAAASEGQASPRPLYESIVGHLDRGGLSVSRAPCPLDDGKAAAEIAESAVPLERRMSEGGAKLYGNLIEGDLTLGSGQRGGLQGWWHAWKGEVPGVGFTDVDTE